MSPAKNEPCPRNEIAVGFVLHALEPHEDLESIAHLAECESCREVVRGAEGVFSSLGATVPQFGPPTGLRSDLLSLVAETPQLNGHPRTDPEGPYGPVPRTGRPAPAADRPRQQRNPHGPDGPAGRGPGRTRGRRTLRVVVSLAAAAVLGMGGLGIYTVQVQDQRDAEIARAQQLTDLLVRSGLPGADRATLTTADGAPVATVVVAGGEGAVVTAGLAPNDASREIYVVWGIGENGTPAPLGSFDATPGTTAHPFPVGASYATYAISREPGRAVPTTPTEVVGTGRVT